MKTYKVRAVLVDEKNRKKKKSWTFRSVHEMSEGFSRINDDLLRQQETGKIESYTIEADF